MAKKGKGESSMSPLEFRHNLGEIEKNLMTADNKETLEKIKLALIKLFDVVKKVPALQEFEPMRIALLKECNLNLQFINRDDDIWNMVTNAKLEQAYEESIDNSKRLNSHPDRELIKPWVRSVVFASLAKIAEMASAIPKPKDPVVSGDQTIMPGRVSPPANAPTSMPAHAISPEDSAQNTFKSPFPFSPPSQPTTMPQVGPNGPDRGTPKVVPNVDFETLFKPGSSPSPPFSQGEEPVQQTYIPQIPPQKTFPPGTNENSISTYWVRSTEQETGQTNSAPPNIPSESNSPSTEMSASEFKPFPSPTKPQKKTTGPS